MGIIVLVSVVVCVLSVILFFKVWVMTDDVRAIRDVLTTRAGTPGGGAPARSFDSLMFKTMVDAGKTDEAAAYLAECQKDEMLAVAVDREFYDRGKKQYFRITTYSPVKWFGNCDVEELGEKELLDPDSEELKRAEEIIARYGKLYAAAGKPMPDYLATPAAFLMRVNGLK